MQLGYWDGRYRSPDWNLHKLTCYEVKGFRTSRVQVLTVTNVRLHALNFVQGLRIRLRDCWRVKSCGFCCPLKRKQSQKPNRRVLRALGFGARLTFNTMRKLFSAKQTPQTQHLHAGRLAISQSRSKPGSYIIPCGTTGDSARDVIFKVPDTAIPELQDPYPKP